MAKDMSAEPKKDQPFASDLPKGKIVSFCRKWRILELSFFGSIVRSDFGPESDIDVLVRYAPDPGWSLFDHVEAQEELATILGRPVDLVSKRAIERSHNRGRRDSILSEARVYYTDEEAA